MLILSTTAFSIVPLDDKSGREINSAMQAQNYDKVITLIEGSLSELDNKDYYLYTLGNAYYLSENYKKAIDIFDELVETYPESQFYNKAILKKVWALSSVGRLGEAYSLYKERLNYLLSPGRRYSLSEAYLKLARELGDETEQYIPAYDELKTASEYYQDAMKIGLPEEIQDIVEYEYAYAQYRMNKKNTNTIQYFDNIIENFPESEFVDDALYYAGTTYFNIKYYDNAREYFTKLYNEYPNSEYSAEALYNSAKTYNIPNPYNIRNLELASNIINKLREDYPETEYAKTGLYEIANSYDNFSAYQDKAIDLYREFVNVYGEDDKELSPASLIAIGKIYYNRNEYDKAIEVYHEFSKTYPAYKEWKRIQEEIITVKYNKAYNTYSAKEYDKASKLFQEFMNEYPIDNRNPNIMYMIGDIYYQQELWQEAIDKWKLVVSKYPNRTPSAMAQYYIGTILEQKLFKLKEAKEAYEKVSGDYSYQQMAQERIRQLTAKELNLMSQKVFTSDDEYYVSLGLRNIDKVNMKIYNLDLKEYFISQNKITNIEDLDIILIKPDYQFEVNYGDEIDDTYEEFKYFENKIKLPINEPGSYVVYVESEEYKSTVLYLVSDIAMTIKSTKDSAMIHIKDLVSEESLSDINVMVSTGSSIIGEYTTDTDGLLKLDLEKLREEKKISTSTLRYFAYKDKHYTSTDLYTGGVYTPVKNQSAGYIFTDKAKYKPGDTINYKAILRNLNQGVVEQLTDEKFTITFTTYQEGQIYKTTSKLNEYGSLFGSINLPKNLSSSSYNSGTLSISSKNYSFSKSDIAITMFKPVERELKVKFDKVAYKLDEKIKLSISGYYLSGAPTSDASIDYYIDGEGWQKTKLDENGKFEYELDASLYPNYNSISATAYFSDDTNQTTFTGSAYIIMKDFSLKLNPTKDIYLPDEKAQIKIIAKDHLEQPIEKALTVRVSRTRIDTSIIEVVETMTVNTDANGEYVYEYGDNIGGSYTLYVEGLSENGIPVSTSTTFRIISEEYGDPLEILPEGLEFKVGETKPVKVYSKVEGGLALFTVERAKILHYELITLEKGVNNIDVSVTETYAPNSMISISFVKQDGFYHSSKELEIKSGIEIDIKPDAQTYKPASDVKLSVNTKDVYGNDLSSEVMIAVVDEAVLQATNTSYEEIKDVFYKALTLNYVTQTGSMPFTYIGTQNNIDADLLAERERREVEKFEKTREEERKKAEEESRDNSLYDMPTTTNIEKKEKSRMDMDYDIADESMDMGGELMYEEEEAPAEPSAVEDLAPSLEEEEALRELLKDTAFFKPDVVTDRSGNAELMFTLPDNLTRWKIFVVANNERSLFGMNSVNIVSTRDLVVKVDAPVEFIEGDTFSFNVNLQNNSSKIISEDLKIAMTQDDKILDGQTESFELKPQTSTQLVTNPLTAPADNFKLQAVSKIDGEVREIKSNKWATTNRTGVEGFTDKTVFRYIKPEENILNKADDKKIVVRILPNTSKILKEIKDNDCPYIFGVEALTQTLIINLNLYKYLLVKESDNLPSIDEVENEIRNNISALEMWSYSGYWTFIDEPGYGDIDYNITAMAYYALSSAKQIGFEVDNNMMKSSAEKLLSYYRTLDNNSVETKALIAFALSVTKYIDYNKVNDLFTMRNSLSIRGLSSLSVALNNLERKGDADTVNTMLLERILEDDVHIMEDIMPRPDYISDWYTVQAFGLYAVLQTKGLTPEIEERINMLTPQIYAPFTSPNFLTFASLMYYKYLIEKDEIQPDFLLTINVNDEEIFKKRVDNHSDTIEVSSDDVQAENKIEINIEGNKGKLTYEAYLEYSFSDEIPENINNKDEYLSKWFNFPKYMIYIDEEDYQKIIQKNQKQYGKQYKKQFGKYKVEQNNNEWLNMENQLVTQDLQYQTYSTSTSKGRAYPISKNYDVLTKEQPEEMEKFKNKYGNYDIIQEVSSVPKDYTISVRLDLSYPDKLYNDKYYILEDTIPAGFTLIEDSISGANAHKKIGNKVLFYLDKSRKYSQSIIYNIKAIYQGKYRTFPPKYYSSRFKSFEVVEEADTVEVKDEDYNIYTNYKLSPYELYPLGNLYFDLGMFDEAEKHLDELFENWWLKPSYRKVVAYNLMKIALAKGNNSDKVVAMYEILRDEFPTTKISLEDIRDISLAYEETGQGDKAYYLVESLYRSYFGQEFDLAVTQLLEEKYETSYDTSVKLSLDYPDLPVAKNGLYSYSQALYAKLNSLGRGNREKLEDGTLLADYLYEQTYSLLTDYLTLFPETFNTDEVSFVLMNLMFDTKRYETSYRAGQLFIDRFSDSQFLDDYMYLSGLALFSDNRIDEATSLLERVAYEKFKDSEGILRFSPNRLYALRLIAQSLHSKGDVDEAIKIYEEIKSNFTDAKRSLEILQEKLVQIDDVITTSVDESTIMTVRHKNIDNIKAKIYKVDFVILALTEKNLSDVTQVNLSGIKPLLEQEYELTYEKNYLPSETDIELPITDTGAYLVVIRSDVGERSAIIVKSDMKMDVFEANNGRVRVTVTDEENNFVNDVKMYFIGSQDSSFKITETDIRGMAEVEGIRGTVTIVGEKDGQYLFYRSTKYISGYSYGNDAINNLSEINAQREKLQKINLSILESILEYEPKSLSISEIYETSK